MILSRSVKLPPGAVILMLVCSVLTGCGPAQRAPVEGSVTLDGQPVDGGTIVFAPEDYKDGATVAKADIKNGKYSLDATNGPIPGKYRVEISWKKKTGKQVPDPDTGKPIDEAVQVIPSSYNKSSRNTVEIKASGNKFDYTITSKASDENRPGRKPGPTRNRD